MELRGTPKAFEPLAQGCAEALPGERERKAPPTLKGLHIGRVHQDATLSGLADPTPESQGSAFAQPWAVLCNAFGVGLTSDFGLRTSDFSARRILAPIRVATVRRHWVRIHNSCHPYGRKWNFRFPEAALPVAGLGRVGWHRAPAPFVPPLARPATNPASLRASQLGLRTVWRKSNNTSLAGEPAVRRINDGIGTGKDLETQKTSSDRRSLPGFSTRRISNSERLLNQGLAPFTAFPLHLAHRAGRWRPCRTCLPTASYWPA